MKSVHFCCTFTTCPCCTHTPNCRTVLTCIWPLVFTGLLLLFLLTTLPCQRPHLAQPGGLTQPQPETWYVQHCEPMLPVWWRKHKKPRVSCGNTMWGKSSDNENVLHNTMPFYTEIVCSLLSSTLKTSVYINVILVFVKTLACRSVNADMKLQEECLAEAAVSWQNAAAVGFYFEGFNYCQHFLKDG